MIFTLHREQFIPSSIASVWAYFATPRNLNDLTPPDMAFEILAGADEPMYPGQIIQYKVTVLPGMRTIWLTQITHVQEPIRFIDEQRVGPYRLWIHEHRFQPMNGGVRMTDHVTYALPYGPLGILVHKLFIRHRLEYIFDYRRAKIETLFGKSQNLCSLESLPKSERIGDLS